MRGDCKKKGKRGRESSWGLKIRGGDASPERNEGKGAVRVVRVSHGYGSNEGEKERAAMFEPGKGRETECSDPHLRRQLDERREKTKTHNNLFYLPFPISFLYDNSIHSSTHMYTLLPIISQRKEQKTRLCLLVSWSEPKGSLFSKVRTLLGVQIEIVRRLLWINEGRGAGISIPPQKELCTRALTSPIFWVSRRPSLNPRQRNVDSGQSILFQRPDRVESSDLCLSSLPLRVRTNKTSGSFKGK